MNERDTKFPWLEQILQEEPDIDKNEVIFYLREGIHNKIKQIQEDSIPE